jgi:DNA polymerase-3 subunit delta
VSAPAVLLLWGEDPFLLREAALEALAGLQPREVEAGAWQGGETADLSTPSLFGERRALLVTDCRSLPDHANKELAAYMSGTPDPGSPMILCCTTAERGKPPAALVKMVQPVGQVREVKLPRKDLPGWLGQRAKRRGVELAPDGSAALVEVLGEDAAELDQAVEQLATAFPGARVNRELVGRQFRGLGDQHVWDLCDKAFARDLPASIRSLRSLMEDRDDPLKILGGIASRLRDLIRVRGLPDRMPLTELAQRAGLRFDWQARRYRDQARRFSMEELVAIHDRIVEADRALKNGAGEEVVLPVLITSIAGDG